MLVSLVIVNWNGRHHLERCLESVAAQSQSRPDGEPSPEPGPGGEPSPEPGPGTVPSPEPGPGTVPTPEPGPGEGGSSLERGEDGTADARSINDASRPPDGLGWCLTTVGGKALQ